MNIILIDAVWVFKNTKVPLSLLIFLIHYWYDLKKIGPWGSTLKILKVAVNSVS
jgi:hypothetical protein